MSHFEAVRDHFVEHLGEDKFKVSLKMPDAAVFLTMVNN